MNSKESHLELDFAWSIACCLLRRLSEICSISKTEAGCQIDSFCEVENLSANRISPGGRMADPISATFASGASLQSRPFPAVVVGGFIVGRLDLICDLDLQP